MNSIRDSAQERFTLLTLEHGKAVLGYLARRTVPTQDAADLTAEVFVVAWRRLDAVPQEPEQARAYLLGVARGVLSNHRRGAMRRGNLADRLRAQAARQPTSYEDPAADVEHPVHAALATLSNDDREVLTLTAWEGLTSAQVATVLSLSAAATRQRLTRARARLRTALAEVRDDDSDSSGGPLPLKERCSG